MSNEEIKILEIERKKEFEEFKNSEHWNSSLEESFQNISSNLEFGYFLGYLSCLLHKKSISEHSFDLIFEFLCDYTGGN